MTSKFGKRWGQNHNGVDISLKTGDSVKVAWSGVIVSSEFNRGGYGNLVIVKHDNGLETYYAHLSKLLVSTGMIVKSGDIIGLGGNTGKSFGSHLHFEIRYSGTILNPESIINFYAGCVRDINVFIPCKEVIKNKPLEISDDFMPEEFVSGVALPLKSIVNNVKVITKREYYKVCGGDNYWLISKKKGVNINKLLELNKSKKVLMVGDIIRIN